MLRREALWSVMTEGKSEQAASDRRTIIARLEKWGEIQQSATIPPCPKSPWLARHLERIVYLALEVLTVEQRSSKYDKMVGVIDRTLATTGQHVPILRLWDCLYGHREGSFTVSLLVARYVRAFALPIGRR